MHGLRTVQNIHLSGTLSADQQGVIPGWKNTGRTLLEIAALASNNSAATLIVGIGGETPDDDAYLTAKAIGASGAPVYFTAADFDGILADALRSSPPRLLPQVDLTWKINFNGPGTNEIQTVTLTRNPTGGTFTLTYAGQTTAGIAYNASAATVQTALRALSNITPDGVTVTGNAGGPWTVTFVNAMAETNVAEMTGSASGLTGGVDEVQSVTIGGTPTGGTFTLTYAGQTTAGIAYNADGATVQAALRLLSNITPDKVTVAGAAGGPWTVTFAGALAGQNVAEMTASAALLTGGTNEVQVITVTGTPTGGNFTLSYAGQTTGNLAHNASAATVQTALRALSNLTPDKVTVAGSAGGPYTITFVGALAGTNVAQMTGADVDLSGGGPYAVNVETTVPGVPPDPALTVAIATETAGVVPTLTVVTATAGVALTAAQNVDLFFTFLEGGRDSAVTDLNRLKPTP